MKIPKRATAPFPSGYKTELDVSPELNDDDASYYQSLIGILRWIVELGRVDNSCEVSIMASCMAMPRQEYLETLYHIFGYLNNHCNVDLILDPSEVRFNKDLFKRENWINSPYGITPMVAQK